MILAVYLQCIDIVVRRWLVQMKKVHFSLLFSVLSFIVLIFSMHTFALKWDMGGVGVAYGLLFWTSTSNLLHMSYIIVWLPRRSDINISEAMTAEIFNEWGQFIRQAIPMTIISGIDKLNFEICVLISGNFSIEQQITASIIPTCVDLYSNVRKSIA